MTTTVDLEKPELYVFEADVSRLLHMMVHSVYSDKNVFLRELISNAADACEKLRYEAVANPALITDETLPRILVSLNEEARTLVIDDNGIGMSEEVLAKVNAQKYFTRSGTLQEKGSGFGLILCRDLLQKQGGNLLIESTKGEGSVFTIQLPKPAYD